MNWRLVIAWLLFSSAITAQVSRFDTLTYIPLEIALTMDRAEVRAITLEKLKLEELPNEIFEFKNLVGLRCSKNKLTQIPEEIKNFSKLEFIYLDKNKFEVFPFVIYHLPGLRGLDVSRNKLVALLSGIHQLVNLEYLDVWDTGIAHLPEDLEQLKNLKFVDVRGMTYSPAFIEKWLTKMPKVEFKFDPPCNCKG